MKVFNARAMQPPTPRINPHAMLELLLVKCSGGALDAKAAFKTIAAARTMLELSNGQKVHDASDFGEFLEEMAERLETAPPIEKAPAPVKE
jgi:hypothetical protein